MTEPPDELATEFFQQDWTIYRKLVDNNYLFHREAYGRLRRLLEEEVAPGFRFLDIACGDASATFTAIEGTPIGKYHGIDLSRPALDLARKQLAGLACPVVLEERDFFEALTEQPEPADIVWIGLSLHHFQRDDKLRLMRAIRELLAPGGMLAIYEDTGPDGETRAAWLKRWDAQRPTWTAYTADEWDTISRHVHSSDYPETDSVWHALGREAGFESVRALYRAPTDLFRFYAFSGV
jgi:SAM-dependent methyltransferase